MRVAPRTIRLTVPEISLVDAVAIFFIDHIAFCTAQFLRDDLPCGLRGNAAKILRGDGDIDPMAEFAIRIELTCLFEKRSLLQGSSLYQRLLFERMTSMLPVLELMWTRNVDESFNAFARGGAERLFNSGDNDIALDAFFSFEVFEDGN